MKLTSAIGALILASQNVWALARPSSALQQASRRNDSMAPAKDPMLPLSPDSSFHFEILRAMAMATDQGGDIGEVLVAAQKIIPGNFESFYSVFYELAERVSAVAKTIDATKYPVSARATLFRAATYYRSADFYLHGNWSDPRINSLWAKQTAAFDAAIALLPIPGERITLQAVAGVSEKGQSNNNFNIPAIFYRSSWPGPRPTLIMCNGYDGSQEEMYHYIGQAALDRGINVLTFEGPGQPTVRQGQGLGFINEWERVVTPVVDYALSRPRDVAPRSLALMGMSFGGYLVPRAAASEHRLAAVLALGGIWDFGASIFAMLGPELNALSASGNAAGVDTAIAKVLADPHLDTAMRWGTEQGMWAFKTPKPSEFLTKIRAYTLEGVVKNITAPVFVADAENDLFFPGQAPRLAEALGDKATYHMFKASEGAGEHCSTGASFLRNQVVLDWLEEVLSLSASNCTRSSTE
ncbi:2-6-dihydropseudooxynicotine hydrolase [Apiospora arundinis]|uniref:2-6-dihydropseudooxynicotine hydrolase n=1 Tax=Apiospora arundinis TaxID=335852 RepID=A0ABR2I2C1_9PEZI